MKNGGLLVLLGVVAVGGIALATHEVQAAARAPTTRGLLDFKNLMQVFVTRHPGPEAAVSPPWGSTAADRSSTWGQRDTAALAAIQRLWNALGDGSRASDDYGPLPNVLRTDGNPTDVDTQRAVMAVARA